MTPTPPVDRDDDQRFADELGATRSLRPFANFLLRTRSRQGRDVLAYAATKSQLTYDELVRELNRLGATHLHLEPSATVELARVLALQDEDEAALHTAASLIDAVVADHGLDILDTDIASLYAQILIKSHRMSDMSSMLQKVRLPWAYEWSLIADSLNPHVVENGSATAWMRQVNKIFTDHGLEPIEILSNADSPFDGLVANPSGSASGPLVTIVMPAYSPNASIVTSVRSIIRQSWQDWELVVVDDASPSEFAELFHRVSQMDDRIRLVRGETNGGTYVARNLGVQQARGEFLTFQDSDDWSHPRRIEHQVRELQTHPGKLALRSWSVRAYPDLTFTYLGYPPNRTNASSLMFHRTKVLERLGSFDTARKSGDMEFIARLQAAAPRSLRTMREFPPLAIVQLLPGSLSRSDAIPGWTHWARIAHRDAYTAWHNKIRKEGVTARLPLKDTRPFPLPDKSWEIVKAQRASEMHYDVLVLNDWRRARGPQTDIMRDIDTMVATGRRVAVAHAESPRTLSSRRAEKLETVQQMINDGLVDFVHLEQPVRARLVLVVDPSCLHMLPEVQSRTVADAVVMVTGDFDALPHCARAFTKARCTHNALTLFSRDPQWVDRNTSRPESLPYSIGESGGPVLRRCLGPRPVIGRPSIDHSAHWPATARDLLDSYSNSDLCDIRIRGGAEAAKKAIDVRFLPPNWTVFPAQEIDWRTYLASLDFFVYFFDDTRDDVAHSQVLDAMASGCVVVLPDSQTSTYGEAAVYVHPHDVTRTVLDLHENPDQYLRQQKRSLDFARRYPSLAQRLEALLGS